MVDESVSGFDPDRKPVNEDELRFVLQINILSIVLKKGYLEQKVAKNNKLNLRLWHTSYAHYLVVGYVMGSNLDPAPIKKLKTLKIVSTTALSGA